MHKMFALCYVSRHINMLFNEELDKLAPILPEIKQMSFEHINHILNYIVMILCGTVYYLKYRRAQA